MNRHLFESATEAEANYRRMLHVGRLDKAGLERLFAGGPVETLPWLRACAIYGHVEAQLRLGQRLLDGAQGIERDSVGAYRWFIEAAERGSAEGDNMAGRCLESGWGAAIDLSAAAARYRRAAESGLDWGQYNLANLLFDGRGVSRDVAAAAGWWRRAADQGHGRAMNLLARCFEEGWGVAPDAETAARWRRASAKTGYFRGQFNHGAWLADQGRVPEAVGWLGRALAIAVGDSLDAMRRLLAAHADPRIAALAGAPA